VVYVSEEDDSRWSVVDGLQRLNSLNRFFANDFKLRGLEVLTELNGESFESLNPKALRILRNGILRIVLIFKESHPEIKYDIFMRLNRGAIKLNEQELRNCLYRGRLNELLMSLRKNKHFLLMVGLDAPHKRMIDGELVLRYLTLSENYDESAGVLRDYRGKMKSTLNRFCDKYKNVSEAQSQEFASKFASTVSKAYDVFGATAFQRIAEDGTTDGRLNRAVMDCVMIGLERIPVEQLVNNRQKVQEAMRLLPVVDDQFALALTYGTSDKKRLEYRLNTWHNALKAMVA
jgi:hypothetical protein